jgi:catechol 2,3-dioxygenase-like lactoylglutathione lyase family enzyme
MAVKGGVLRLLHVSRNVADLAQASAFYCDALGFQLVAAPSPIRPAWAQLPDAANLALQTLRLRLGRQEIELACFKAGGAPYPPDSRANDLWFQHLAIVASGMDAAYQRLRTYAVRPISEQGPQRLPAVVGGVTAFKFRDPDGHPLELLRFPPDAGAAIWLQPHSSAATLGIDHTAISVAAAGRSLAFYSGLLGLREISHQVNRGPEQQRLDALPDVVVEVVGLQPITATPHLELLGYRRPRGRSAATMDLRAIAADRLVLQVQNLPALLGALRAAGTPVLATGAVVSADGSHAALVGDPDGHLLILVE